VRRKKLKADLTQKKFFDFFMLRRLESVFQGQKILVSLAANIKATLPPAVITIHRKVPRDIFIYNVEKFNLLA